VTIGVVLNSPLNSRATSRTTSRTFSRTATLLLGGGALGSMTIAGFAPASTASAPAAAAPDKVMTNTALAAAATSTAASQRQRRATVAVRYAKAQLGDRYRYGGNGPNAWDCSGLVKASWRKAGVTLPRVTNAQYRAVKKKVSWSHLRSGDLVFFYSKGHVGIYVGKGYMVHAPSSGRRVQKVKLGSHYHRQFSGAVRPGA
jgi:murein DD-endopeptidase